MTCAIHVPSEEGQRECGGLAVSVWKSIDGDLPVCEQCEAMIIDLFAQGAPISAPTFDSIPN